MGHNRAPGLTKRQKEQRRAARKQGKAERLARRRARKKLESEGGGIDPVPQADSEDAVAVGDGAPEVSPFVPADE